MRSFRIQSAIWGAILAMVLGGCALQPVAGSFSPVHGPLAELKPAVSYPAQMSGVLSGEIRVSLPGDGTCTGPWSLRSSQQQAFDLAADWDQVYGEAYYTAHVLGVREFVRTTLNCTAGSVVRAELSNEDNRRGNTWGVAEDDHGNLFKVSVYN
jgi:hypothetical protein